MDGLDIIWNISLVCPWDCDFCCTDAVHVRQTRKGIILREDSLVNKVVVHSNTPVDWPEELYEYGLRPNFLDLALHDRQRRGRELLLSEKLAVLGHINEDRVSLDFAGGDPIACAENILVIEAAAKRFGREQISITSTGHSVSRYPFDLIANSIGTFEFTYDELTVQATGCRPLGYNRSNISAAKKFSSAGIKTKCQIPLHAGNSSDASIAQIISDLTQAEISEVLLMRVFPVGRGGQFVDAMGNLSADQTLRAIERYHTESEQINGPKIRLQCALKKLYSEDDFGNNPCNMMQNSFGINYQGLLLTSAWATNEQGRPLSNDFVLGSLLQNNFEDISHSEKFEEYLSRLDENWGHCKIFSYINSKAQGSGSMFARLDPLYSKQIESP